MAGPSSLRPRIVSRCASITRRLSMLKSHRATLSDSLPGVGSWGSDRNISARSENALSWMGGRLPPNGQRGMVSIPPDAQHGRAMRVAENGRNAHLSGGADLVGLQRFHRPAQLGRG